MAITMEMLDQRDQYLGALSPRELQVLKHFAHGDSNKEIARVIGLSPRTVEIHASAVIGKMKARNRAHAAALAVWFGIARDIRPVDPGK